jgi:hypothetical protein
VCRARLTAKVKKDEKGDEEEADEEDNPQK